MIILYPIWFNLLINAPIFLAPIASRDGDFEKVRKLLEDDVIDVNSRCDTECKNGYMLQKSTALHQAAQHLHVDIVSYLIAHGADVRATAGEENWTPLHAVAVNIDDQEELQKGGVERALVIAKLLLNNGADPHATLSTSETPLDWAIRSGTNILVPLLKDSMKMASTSIASTSKSLENLGSMSSSKKEEIKRIMQTLIDQQPEHEHLMVIDALYPGEGLGITIRNKEELSKSDPRRILFQLFSSLGAANVMKIERHQSRSSTGYGGLGTFTPISYEITAVDLDKLRTFSLERQGHQVAQSFS